MGLGTLFHYCAARAFLHVHRYEAAGDAFARVLRGEPDDLQAQFHRAWSLLQVSHRRAEGIASFQDLLRVSPSAAGFFLLGCGLQQESRHDDALAAFDEAARLEAPATADFHYNRALSLTAVRRFEDAVEAYDNAARLNPSDGQAWGGLGAALVELGRSNDAVPCLERAMRISPSPPFGLNLAAALYEVNRGS